MTTCLLIRNPVARHSLEEARLDGALAVARAAGWDISVATTERENHATEIARDAVSRGVDVIVVHGGDGTINETINGLAGTDVALATIRGGTANVWAGEIRMERDPAKAMQQIVEGERRRIDVGKAGERCFLLMAGVGFDGIVVPRVTAKLKRRLGPFSYVFVGVRAMFSAREQPVVLRIDGEGGETPLFWLLVSNTRSYGGITNIMFRAEADDGLFDIGVMHRGGPRRLVVDGVRALLKKHEGSGNIDYLKAKLVEVDTPGLPVQLDGEFWGTTPMRFEVWPQALTVIVPRGLETPLLRARSMREPDAV